LIQNNGDSSFGRDPLGVLERTPSQVLLSPIPLEMTPRDLFQTPSPDLYLAPPFPFVRAQKEALNLAPQHLDGELSSIYFFYFNPKHPLANVRTARKTFASLLH
jgi:hypothetical protein